MKRGWIRLWRKLLDNPLMGRPAYRSLWIEILLRASRDEKKSVMFGGKQIYLKPGQFTTGAYQMAQSSGIARGTVENIIKAFKNEELIEVRSDRHCSLITVKKWHLYQNNEERNEEQVRNNRGTGEEQVRTNQEYKNIRIKEYIAPGEKSPVAIQVKKKKSDPNEPMSLEQFIAWCKKSSQRHIQIIGEWAEAESPPSLMTKGQWAKYIRRHLRVAKDIEPFTQEQINDAYTRMKQATETKSGWLKAYTLETLFKFLTNDYAKKR